MDVASILAANVEMNAAVDPHDVLHDGEVVATRRSRRTAMAELTRLTSLDSGTYELVRQSDGEVVFRIDVPAKV